MESFTQYFTYFQDYKIIYCKQCSIAIPPRVVRSHLQRNHQPVSTATRASIQEAVFLLQDIVLEAADFRMPTEPIHPFLNSTVYYDGYKCQKCHFVARHIISIQEHSKKKHKWVNVQVRGGNTRKKSKESINRIWDSSQACQTLFKAAGWPRFILVMAPTNNEDTNSVVAAAIADRDRQKRARNALMKEQEARQGVRVQADSWVDYTGWPSQLRGQNLDRLHQTTCPAYGEPGADQTAINTEKERALGRVCRAYRGLIQKAYTSCTPDKVGRPALEAINQRETGEKTNEKPFYANHHLRTIQKYTIPILGIIRYLWRTWENRELQHLYSLSPFQSSAMATLEFHALKDSPPARIEDLETHCLSLWICLLNDKLSDYEWKSALVSGLAVIGISPDQGWVPAHYYQQVLSAIVSVSKALVLHLAYTEYCADPDKEESILFRVQAMTNKFLTTTAFNDAPTPMNRILKMRSYAKVLAINQTSRARVSELENGELLIDNIKLSVQTLRVGIRALCEAVSTQFFREVLLFNQDAVGKGNCEQAPLPLLNLGEICDNLGNTTKGFNFLHHPANNFKGWSDWLFTRVSGEPNLNTRFFKRIEPTDTGNKVIWNDSAVSEYFAKVRDFKEKLLVAMHLSGGGPARGTELLSIQHTNGENHYGYRGIFVDRGMVCFATRYHKGYSHTARIKSIYRYIPQELGEVLVYFLGLAQPFIDDVCLMAQGQKQQTAFLWEPALEPSLEDAITSLYMNASDSDTSDQEDPLLSQERGKHKTPANPDGFWSSDRIRRVLRQHTHLYLHVALSINTWRHIYANIHSKSTKDHNVVDVVNSLYYNQRRELDPLSVARAKQSAHEVTTEELIYGRNTTESPWAIERERQEFRAVSMDWHRVLGFPSARVGVMSTNHAREIDHQMSRWKQLAQSNLKTQLQTLLANPDAELRGKQEETLKAIQARKLRILAIMPTGIGKSMLFILPAFVSLESGTTIVVVPLRSIQQDFQYRCDHLGIPCAIWAAEMPPYAARIVLVTPEGAVSARFRRFVAEKRSSYDLDRIVIDECHVILESTPKWRPDVLRLVEMTKMETQLLYLTATLPPPQVPEFLMKVGVHRDDITLIRDRTTRRNISYQVQHYPDGALDDTLHRLVKEKQGKYPPEAQIIVYCKTRLETERFGELLDCTAYHAGPSISDEEKARMIRSFVSGAEKLCTATNVLGLGLDAPSVRVVIHVVVREKLEQYVQESGRAGRKGDPSEAIILQQARAVHHNKQDEYVRKSFIGRNWSTDVRAYMSGAHCRRVILDKAMDGYEERKRCEEGEAKCDVCMRVANNSSHPEQEMDSGDLDRQGTEDISTFLVARKQQCRMDIRELREREANANKLKDLSACLERLHGVCLMCMVHTGQPEEHSWPNCHRITKYGMQYTKQKREKIQGEIKWVERIKLEPYAGCTWCLVPQALCYTWQESAHVQGVYEKRGPIQCQHKGLVQNTVAILLASARRSCHKWIEERATEAGLTEGCLLLRWAKLFAKKVKMGYRDSNMLCAFLLAWDQGELDLVKSL